MRFVWKGKYINEEQLKVGHLPENAVKFKEPTSLLMVNVVSSLFIIPVIMIVAIAIFIKKYILGTYYYSDLFNPVALILAFAAIIPHEFFHAICFPKEAEVQFWFSPKHLMAFVFSSYPISKYRYVFMSFLPNLILGFLPLVLWVVLPIGDSGFSSFLLCFSYINLLFGVGDYLNIFNALTQMPREAVTQLYGFNSYWYYPKGSKPE